MIDAGRTSVANTGEAFAATAFTLWGYNTRSELESSKRYTGTYTPTPDSGDEVTGQRRLYEYDPIGNRTESTEGTGSATFYCANELNQYKATRGSGDSCPTPTSPTEEFEYDADGNLIEDGTFAYTWDGENRLIGVETRVPFAAEPSDGDVKLGFKYDYMSRRVQKKVWTWSEQVDEWLLQTDLRFVYDRWNVVLVLDGLDNNAVLKKYTWGLDLSGQRGNPTVEGIHGAGGIGGLLTVEETTGTHAGSYWFFYDANGNVGQVVKNTTNYPLAAHYEYDAYGNILGTLTGYAAANPFRFSTKWFDGESQQGYWGYRYYSPRTGRWLNRDPIEEKGGHNLQAFVNNRPTDYWDPDGTICVPTSEICVLTGSAPGGTDNSVQSICFWAGASCWAVSAACTNCAGNCACCNFNGTTTAYTRTDRFCSTYVLTTGVCASRFGKCNTTPIRAAPPCPFAW